MTAFPPPPNDGTFRLLAACLRPLADPTRIAAVRACAVSPIDGEALVALARRHRVEGFVAEALAAADIVLPPEHAAALTTMARAARLHTLRAAGEEVRVGRALVAAGVDALFLKGATVAMRAHGRLGLKTSWDVDVLIAPPALPRAAAVLAELGYKLDIFDGVTEPVRIARWLAAHKDSAWYNRARGTTVELHTALTDNGGAIARIGMNTARQTIAPMPGAPLETFADAPLFAYLAFHGASHLWARLKWIADVAALIHVRDVAQLYQAAVALGGGRTPGLAIVLAHELFGVAAPPQLLAAIRRDRTTRRLLRESYRAMTTSYDGDALTARSLRDMLAFARSQGALVPGLAYRWGTIRRFLTLPARPEHLAIPRWALPGAILAALPFRLVRRAAQSRGKTASSP